jgi:hypothetical protein
MNAVIETHKTEAAPIRHGLDALSIDNRYLGRVKEVTESSFRVGSRLRRDFWLHKSRAVYVDDSRIGVPFRKDALDRFRMNGPSADEFAAPAFIVCPEDAQPR